MNAFDSRRDRAQLLLLVLGVAITLAVLPFAAGLLGALVLYVGLAPIHRRVSAHVPRRIAAAALVVATALLILLPIAWLLAVAIDGAPAAVLQLRDSPDLRRLAAIRVGEVDVGTRLIDAGGAIVSWVSSQALRVIGGAVPLIGTALTAVLQGMVVALGFAATGLGDPWFWGVVTAIVSVLPVFGSALVWFPAAVALAVQGRYGAAAGLAALGALVASNIDNVMRPLVNRRVSNLHPMTTLVGAFAGVGVLGLPGILLGPLAITYFFEVAALYRTEYGGDATGLPNDLPAAH
jgi:predicted PurR-regulated permease PerM